jgi:hypothetical protein
MRFDCGTCCLHEEAGQCSAISKVKSLKHRAKGTGHMPPNTGIN